MSVFYKPENAWAADFIPFYWQGQHHLFYLKDYRDPEGVGPGVDWFHIATSDFVNFEDWGEALHRGARESQDLYAFTGSAIEHAGTFHIFYTGHNFDYVALNKPQEAILHATSPDLRTWTKDPDFFFLAPTAEGYESHDWRDPFVVWNPQKQEWLMLLAARKTTGPSRHRGLVACATSPDLKNWTVTKPFWEPDLYFTHECPDLFKFGDWWYLIWSEFSDRQVTRYRMSRHQTGPWLRPADDCFDTRAYYAAKTGGDEQQRYMFGWLAPREGETDTGNWQWGGSLVVHELRQRPDGTLAVQIPENLASLHKQDLPLQSTPVLGQWQTAADSFSSDTPTGLAALLVAEHPEESTFRATVQYAPGTASFGLLLHAAEDLAHYYQVRFEPDSQRVVFDLWPRPGDKPFIFERPMGLQPDTAIEVTCLTSGSCVVIYINSEIAISCRMYDHTGGFFGLFAAEGSASFAGVTVKVVEADN